MDQAPNVRLETLTTVEEIMEKTPNSRCNGFLNRKIGKKKKNNSKD